VIRLTRINGQQITVNSDLIKLVESNPDTMISLVSGDKILVSENAGEVVARVIEFKRAVLADLLINSSASSVAVTAAGSAQWARSGPTHPEEKSRG
jgi:flagellar protein FlbD